MFSVSLRFKITVSISFVLMLLILNGNRVILYLGREGYIKLSPLDVFELLELNALSFSLQVGLFCIFTVLLWIKRFSK